MAIYTKLLEHQEKIVSFMRNKPYGAIFSDYGTGKTLCALAHIELSKFRRILVVSTKTSIQSTWVSEIVSHTNYKYIQLLGTRSQKLQKLQYGFSLGQINAGYYHSEKLYPVLFLINFDGVKNIAVELGNAGFDLMVVDESTKIKSPKIKRTQYLWALGKTSKCRLIMTGFPVTEALFDLYAQVKFLDGGESLGNSYYSFLDTYFTRYGLRYAPKKKAIGNLLTKLKPFCIRVTNESLKLPPKLYKKMDILPTLQQNKILKELNDLFRLEFGKVKIDTQHIFALVSRSLQIADGFIQDTNGNLEPIDTNKDEALVDLIDDIDVTKNKVLIWAQFRFSVAKIKRYLERLNYNVMTLTGDTKDANTVVNLFQTSPKHNILIAIQKKASASITLTSCKYAIYYSNMWSYDERANSEARIYRKGSEKHKNVVYTDLVTKDSIEEKVYDCLRRKKNLVDLLKKEFSLLGTTTGG